jgi:hypothetical protein
MGIPTFVLAAGQFPIDLPVNESITLIAFAFHFDNAIVRLPALLDVTFVTWVSKLLFYRGLEKSWEYI